MDADALESVWRAALHAGLEAAGSDLRIADDDATFVYYGDTIDALVRGGAPPPVTVHLLESPAGAEALGELPTAEAAFALAVAREVLASAGVDAPVQAEGFVADAILEALAETLAAIDRFVPGLSGIVLLLLVRDVYAYLHDDEVRAVLDDGLAKAMPDDEPAIVVAHSLGSLVAYRVLRADDGSRGWDVPVFLMLGSPLAITAIRDVLQAEAPLRAPASVQRWVDARDPRDIFAVHGLTPAAFPLDPGSPVVEPLVVDNRAPDHHEAAVELDGVPVGYLAEAPVARVVAEAFERRPG